MNASTLKIILPCAFLLRAFDARADLLLRNGVVETGKAAARGKPADLPQDGMQRLWLVATDGETTRGELEAAGLRALAYIPDDGFLVRGTSADLARAEALPGVVWTGRYDARFKVDPDFREDSEALVLRVDDNAARASKPAFATELKARATLDLAESEDVVWIGRAPQWTPLNDVARAQPVMDVDRARDFMGLTGAGEILGIADSGLDTGDYFFLHPDLRGRVTAIARGRQGLWNDLWGHGTSVAGCAAGDGSGSLGQYAGVAPGAWLVFQAVADAGGDWSGMNPWDGLLNEQYTLGTRVFSLSAAASPNGVYDALCAETDGYLWNHPDFFMCSGAGNSGPGAQTVFSPSTAKNVVSVGASVTKPNSLATLAVAQSMWSGSSRGPCQDGRVKPDLVAPGSYSRTTRTQAVSPGDLYANFSGTSCATPYVAGCAVLVRQWLREQRGISNPSAALVRAILYNGAQPFAAGQNAQPNNMEGWGHVSVFPSLHTLPGMTNRLHDAKAGLRKGEEDVYDVPSQPGAVVHAMLAYTDYPGCPCASKMLVNDLDVLVYAPDGSLRHAATNRLDNAERVSFEPSDPGVWRVVVRGHKVPFGPQPYALVMRSEPLAPVITSLRVSDTAAELAFFSRAQTPYDVLSTGDLLAPRPWPAETNLPQRLRMDPARAVTLPLPPGETKRFWTMR
ncbi:MAG: S8 family serine peptidase [Kiritimatiellaeota bacterium]|nr:S8 family serine peptidase [Kiritimatiellota bacterium]